VNVREKVVVLEDCDKISPRAMGGLAEWTD
jgi:hypothetical protein